MPRRSRCSRQSPPPLRLVSDRRLHDDVADHAVGDVPTKMTGEQHGAGRVERVRRRSGLARRHRHLTGHGAMPACVPFSWRACTSSSPTMSSCPIGSWFTTRNVTAVCWRTTILAGSKRLCSTSRVTVTRPGPSTRRSLPAELLHPNAYAATTALATSGTAARIRTRRPTRLMRSARERGDAATSAPPPTPPRPYRSRRSRCRSAMRARRRLRSGRVAGR